MTTFTPTGFGKRGPLFMKEKPDRIQRFTPMCEPAVAQLPPSTPLGFTRASLAWCGSIGTKPGLSTTTRGSPRMSTANIISLLLLIFGHSSTSESVKLDWYRSASTE